MTGAEPGMQTLMCWTLDARDPTEARSARKAVTAAVGEFTDSAETLGAAELVVGELLSNAARHADGHVCVEVTAAEGHAQISVHDASFAFALDLSRPVDEYAESGRGLFIISELARRISVVPLDGMGKCVSVTLDLPLATGVKVAESCERRWLRHQNGVCMRPRVSRYFPSISVTPNANA